LTVIGVTSFFLLSRVDESAKVNARRGEKVSKLSSPPAKDSVSSGDSYRLDESTKEKVQREKESLDVPSAAVKGNVSSGDRYNVAPCGAVEDSKTRLEWFVGPDKTMSWDEAKTWIGSLTACGGNWQMPTIEQLATLYDSRFTAGTGFYKGGRNWPAHIHPVFASIGSGSWAWSREARDSRTARAFNCNQGVAAEYEKDNKSYTTRAFAVRTSQSKQKR
jgi:hypothetical protein